MRQHARQDALVGPVEQIDTESVLALTEPQRQSDEEAPLESSDLDNVADMPCSLWRRTMCPQIAAAKRDDIPRTLSYCVSR